MKKCSKSNHHALAELNITPRLDLAFVLLVIFIITTTPVVNDLEVDLPHAATRPKEPKSQLHYVTVDNKGQTFLDKDVIELASLGDRVIALRLDTPDLNVILRASAHAKYGTIVQVVDELQRANLGKVNLATEPLKEGEANK